MVKTLNYRLQHMPSIPSSTTAISIRSSKLIGTLIPSWLPILSIRTLIAKWNHSHILLSLMQMIKTNVYLRNSSKNMLQVCYRGIIVQCWLMGLRALVKHTLFLAPKNIRSSKAEESVSRHLITFWNKKNKFGNNKRQKYPISLVLLRFIMKMSEIY